MVGVIGTEATKFTVGAYVRIIRAMDAGIRCSVSLSPVCPPC